MAKHDPREPAQPSYVDTYQEMNELCDLWNDRGGEDYLKRIDSDDYGTLYRVYGEAARRLAAVVAKHPHCQAGRRNPRYWRGSRTAR